jgi:hypothetical protein
MGGIFGSGLSIPPSSTGVNPSELLSGKLVVILHNAGAHITAVPNPSPSKLAKVELRTEQPSAISSNVRCQFRPAGAGGVERARRQAPVLHAGAD